MAKDANLDNKLENVGIDPSKYEHIGSMDLPETYHVIKHGQKIEIDGNGNIINTQKPKYIEFGKLPTDDYIEVRKDGRYNLIDRNGNLLFPIYLDNNNFDEVVKWCKSVGFSKVSEELKKYQIDNLEQLLKALKDIVENLATEKSGGSSK